jgi:hypothetical protein
VAGWIPGVWVGFIIGALVTPDLDVNGAKMHTNGLLRKKSRLLAWFWRAYWWGYSKAFSHGGSSHWPFFGTLVRFALVFWPAILWWQGDKTWLMWAYGGMVVADLNHIFMDLPRGTSRWMETLLALIHAATASLSVWFFLM